MPATFVPPESDAFDAQPFVPPATDAIDAPPAFDPATMISSSPERWSFDQAAGTGGGRTINPAPAPPQQPVGESLMNAAEQSKGGMIRAAGGLLSMLASEPPLHPTSREPTPPSPNAVNKWLTQTGAKLKEAGASEIQNAPIDNPIGEAARVALGLAPLLAAPEAAPAILGAQSAGGAQADIEQAARTAGIPADQAQRLASSAAPVVGLATGLTTPLFSGVPGLGKGMVSTAIGGGLASAISGATQRGITSRATGQPLDATALAKESAITAATAALLHGFVAAVGADNPALGVKQPPPGAEEAYAKVTGILREVDAGRLDPRAVGSAFARAKAGEVGDFGPGVLTPHDAAVITAVANGDPVPPPPEAAPAPAATAQPAPFEPPAADAVQSTPFTPPAGDEIQPAVMQKGGPSEETQRQEGRQEVLTPEAITAPGAAVSPDAAAPIAKSPAKTIALNGFSKQTIENELLANHQAMTLDAAEGPQIDRMMQSYQNPWTFSVKPGETFPGEVRQMMEDNPALRTLFTKGPGGNGADALGDLGYDRYLAVASRAVGGRAFDLRDATKTAESSPDPKMQLYAAIYQNMPQRANLASKPTTDPEQLQAGTEFQLFGHTFQVVEDADGYKVLRDGGAFPELPADALGAVPYDKGTLRAGEEPNVPDFVPPPGDTFFQSPNQMPVQSSMFGDSETTAPLTGTQQPMFGQTAVDVPAAHLPGTTAADAKIAQQYSDTEGTRPLPFRRGAVNLTPLTDFVTQDVVPSAKAVGNSIISAKDDLQRTFAPQTRGAAAGFAKGALREAKADLDRRDVIAERAFHGSERFFEHQPKQHNLDFYTAVETGQGITDPNLKPARDLLRGGFEDRFQQMKALGIEPGYIQDYLPHLYKDPAKAAAFASDFLSRRPFEGSKFFKKQRVYPTLQDGVNAGLEPRTYNPMTMGRLALHQMDKYITVSKVKQELKTVGMRKFVSAGQKAPAGWSTTSDRADTVYGLSQQNERVIRGQYAYPEPVVNLIDNYLSPGLAGKQWYRGLMWLKNNMNLFNLGYSAFHITFTTGNSFAAKIGTAMQYAASGDLKMAAVKAAEVPVAPFVDLVRGSRMLSEWVKPGSAGHDYAQLADAYLAGGGRGVRPAAYRETIARRFGQAIEKGNLLGAAVRLPAATAQAIGHVIMESYVPRIKNGAAVDQLRMALDAEPVGPINRARLRELMGQIVDRQDDQFGELEYSNLFWNKTAHHLGQLAIRAQGWTLGSLRLGYKAAADTAASPLRIARGGPPLTLSMARVIGIGIATAALGAIVQKLLSGKDPESVKDLVYPRTGNRDRQGNDVRLKLPTYANEGVSWYKHPLTTLGHKLSPLVSEMYDAIRNQDYYGNKIADPKAPVQQQIKDYAVFFAKQQLPFSVQSQQQLMQEGAPLSTRLTSALGITRANAEIIRTPAMNLAYELASAQRPAEGMTPEQAKRSQLKAQIADAMAQDPKKGEALLDQALRSGQLVPADTRELIRRANETPLQYKVKQLSAPDAVQVFDVADAAERQQVAGIILQKLARARTLPPEQRMELIRKVQAGMTAGRKAG